MRFLKRLAVTAEKDPWSYIQRDIKELQDRTAAKIAQAAKAEKHARQLAKDLEPFGFYVTYAGILGAQTLRASYREISLEINHRNNKKYRWHRCAVQDDGKIFFYSDNMSNRKQVKDAKELAELMKDLTT